MKIDINSLDIEQNFWSLYPEFKAIEPFKSLYGKDKGTKEESSKVMWFIAVGHHPSSAIHQMDLESKYKLLSISYFKNANFPKANKKILDEGVPVFLEATLGSTQRQILKLEALLDKRGKFIETQEYDLTNFEDLDKMFAATDKIQGTFDKLRTKLAEEQEAGTARGSKNLSAGDMGLG